MKTKSFLLITLSFLIFPNMAKSQVKVQQTAGHDVLGEFAPEFAHLNDNILFGEDSHILMTISFLARYGAAMTCYPCATVQSLP